MYDCKRSGSVTVSHVHFGLSRPTHPSWSTKPISWPAISSAFSSASACWSGLGRPAHSCSTAHVVRRMSGDYLPRQVQSAIREKRLRGYVIDGNTAAPDSGMRGRVNTIMQTCFFALSGVLPRDEATLAHLYEVEVARRRPAPSTCAKFVRTSPLA